MDPNADVSITISARPNSTIQRRMPIRDWNQLAFIGESSGEKSHSGLYLYGRGDFARGGSFSPCFDKYVSTFDTAFWTYWDELKLQHLVPFSKVTLDTLLPRY